MPAFHYGIWPDNDQPGIVVSMPGWWEDVKFGIGLEIRWMVLLADMVEVRNFLHRDWNFPPVCHPVSASLALGSRQW
jgi:hypothetical protein